MVRTTNPDNQESDQNLAQFALTIQLSTQLKNQAPCLFRLFIERGVLAPPITPSGNSSTTGKFLFDKCASPVAPDNVGNGDNRSWSDNISGANGSGESRSKRATSKSGEVGGGVVEFCDTKCSECGGFVPYQSANIKTPTPSLPDLPDESVASVSSLGSDDVQNQTTKPELRRYPKWESFCKDTGYSVVPLTGTHPVTSSPIWAAMLHHRGLINFGESLAWEADDPPPQHDPTTMQRPGGFRRERRTQIWALFG